MSSLCKRKVVIINSYPATRAHIHFNQVYICTLALRSVDLADAGWDDVAGGSLGGVLGTLAKTTLGETGPDLASVDTAGEGSVGVQDGITGLDKVGVAGLPVKEGIVSTRAFSKRRWYIASKGGRERRTYRAIPSMTSFMVRYLPSVGIPSASRVGWAASFLPYLSIRFHMTS